MENNFTVEEYLINITRNSSKHKKYYIIKKKNSGSIEIFAIENNEKYKVQLDSINSQEERNVVERYLRKAKTARLKYGTSYLNSLLSRDTTLDLMKYGSAKEIECVKGEENLYRVVKYYYNVKGNMFYKIMGQKW